MCDLDINGSNSGVGVMLSGLVTTVVFRMGAHSGETTLAFSLFLPPFSIKIKSFKIKSFLMGFFVQGSIQANRNSKTFLA